MGNYTTIPKEIIEYKSKSKLLDIYTFACIKSTMDYKNGISKINQRTVQEKFDIPERTLRDAILRLEEYRLLNIQQKMYENKNPILNCKSILKNYYKFNLNPDNYFFVDNNFFNMNIPKEIKGFLLILKAICLNNTNAYISSRRIKNGINKTELSHRINMDIKTIQKYLIESQKLDEIVIIDDKIIIKNNFFPIIVNKQNKRLKPL